MSDAVGLQGYAGTEEPGKGNSAKPLVTSMSWHCMLQVASCQYPASERVADSSGSSCKDIPVCRWAGRFSMFVSATALLPSIDEGHAAARTVDCGLRTGTGSILFAREANAGSGRTRSANYLKMTPNYQCKVSWYHLPSANIPPKTREKRNKGTKKMKIQTLPPFPLPLPVTRSKFAGIRFSFRCGSSIYSLRLFACLTGSCWLPLCSVWQKGNFLDWNLAHIVTAQTHT